MNITKIGCSENIYKSDLNKIVNYLFEALSTDGSHHKQWYLEEILKMLINNKIFETSKKNWEWEEGVAP